MCGPNSSVRRRCIGGAPYEYAAVAPEGARLVFAAGACPLNENGEVVALGDYDEQARVALQNLKVALEEAGSGLDRVLKSTVYVVVSRPGAARPGLVGGRRGIRSG